MPPGAATVAIPPDRADSVCQADRAEPLLPASIAGGSDRRSLKQASEAADTAPGPAHDSSRQYIRMASLMNCAKPSAYRSMLCVKRGSAIYISPNPDKISLVQG